MTIKVVTSFQTLMHYAAALGEAKKSKDPERIAAAQTEHDAYRDMCLACDEMHLGMTYGDIASCARGQR